MDFQNIIGNTALKSLISSHIRSKTLSHAYIIEGIAGSGKRTLAKEISKALCCEGKGDVIPCQKCRSCTRTSDGYNTDIYTLSRGDKATISVDEVREMTQTLGYYPDDGDVKVYIIEDAERMTAQAQNALLLSLEEPPSYVVFLLLTVDASLLLETVRSRAQTLKTEVFSTSFVADWLRALPEAKRYSDEQIATAASVSRGALGTALSTLTEKNSKSASITADASTLIDLLCKDNKSEAIIFASGLKYTRAEFELFFDYAVFAVRDLLSAKCNSDSTVFYADCETPRDKSSRVRISKLMRIYDALLSARDDITQSNAHIYAVMTTLAASV